MKRYERTRALVEGDPALARAIVCEVERDGAQGAVAVLDEPREELVMVQARETAQGSLFFLGEALMTSCRVRVATPWAWASCWAAIGAALTSLPWWTRCSPARRATRGLPVGTLPCAPS